MRLDAVELSWSAAVLVALFLTALTAALATFEFDRVVVVVVAAGVVLAGYWAALAGLAVFFQEVFGRR